MTQIPQVWLHGTETSKATIPYMGCGLDDIWLVSGYEIETFDGEEAITVRDLDGLHAAIGRSLVMRKKLLTGKEIRFLRIQMDLSQSKLARLMGCDAQQIARYEKDQNKMPGATDRILRVLFREHLKDPVAVHEFLDALDRLDGRLGERQLFAETPKGWIPKAA